MCIHIYIYIYIHTMGSFGTSQPIIAHYEYMALAKNKLCFGREAILFLVEPV